MPTLLNPYISFKDNTREAMQFYQTVFGGKLDLNTFGESGMTDDPAEKDKIMHAMLQADNGITFMASDTPPGMPFTTGTNISISLSGQDEAELRGYWDKLAADGTITLPLEKAPWGDIFGMVEDKFGISWMVDIGPAASQA